MNSIKGDAKAESVTQLKRGLLVAALLVVVGWVPAVAQVAYLPEKDQGEQAIIEAANKITPPKVGRDNKGSEDSVKNILTAKLEEADIQTGWDTDKNRYAGVAFYEFIVEPDIDLEDYFVARQIAAVGAIVRAQVDLAVWLGAEAGINVSIQNPGDPFFADKKHSKDLAEIKAKLDAARLQAEKEGVQLEKAEEVVASGVTTVDRIKIASDALLKKLEPGFDEKAVQDVKQSKAEEIRKAVLASAESLKLLEAEYEQYRENYQRKSIQAGMDLTFDQVIFGLSAVCWSENFTSDGRLQMGVAYVWSPKLAKSAHAALVGDPSMDDENAKGTESVSSWIKRQDLATFGSSRYFVDNGGDRWFIGSALVPNSVDEATTIAKMDAIMALYMPLYSNLQGKQIHQLSAKSGKKGSSFAQGVHEELRSFASHNTRGMNQLRNVDIQWSARTKSGGQAKSESVSAVVMGLNAKSAAAALKGGVQMALAAAAVERENNRRRLEQADMRGLVDAGKHETPLSRVPPSAQDAQLPGVTNVVQSDPAPRPREIRRPPVKLVPEPGSKVTPGKPQDDF